MRALRLALCLLSASAACLSLSACTRSDADAHAPSVSLDVRGRRIDIVAGPGGYKPDLVRVQSGEQVTLVFTRTVKSECLAEIAIPSLHVRKALPLDQPVAVPFKADYSGIVPFSCGMDMVHGSIAVE